MSTGLVVFDMDGTVLNHNSWLKLHHAFGLDDGEDEVMLRWYSEGVLTYREWTDLIMRIYRARGRATRQRALEVFDRCTPHLAAHAVVAEVRARGFEVALVSGGIDILVESIARRLGIERHRANHRMVFDGEDQLVGMEMSDNDDAFKVTTLKDFCSEIGIPANACFCVGDGLNDRGVFDLTGHGILLCPPDTLPPFESYWKRVSDLSEVPGCIPPGPGVQP